MFTWKATHQESLWKRGTRQLGNGLLLIGFRTYRHWIQEDNHSGQNDDGDEDTDDNPLVVPPNDVAKSFKRWREPTERCSGATGEEITRGVLRVRKGSWSTLIGWLGCPWRMWIISHRTYMRKWIYTDALLLWLWRAHDNLYGYFISCFAR